MTPATEPDRNIAPESQLQSCGGGSMMKQNTGHQQQRMNESENEQRRRTYPCRHPHNYNMSDVTNRKRSFYNWPGQTAATTDQLAEAGLYYLGNGDQTKCFYCNGGLENWEWNDEPFSEHAKWFPQCEYVLQKKGFEFVSSVSAQFPNISRPIVYQSPSIGASVSPSTRGSAHVYNLNNTTIVTSGNSVTITRNGRPVVHEPFQPVEPRRVVRSLDERVMEAMNHELTGQMRAFGFTEELIKKVIKRRLTPSANSMFDSMEEFLDAVQREENEERERVNLAVATESNTPRASNERENIEVEPTSSQSPPQPSVETRLEDIRNERRCKICLDEDSSCVFEPCGHMCACLQCATQLRNCPICRSQIFTIMRVYTA